MAVMVLGSTMNQQYKVWDPTPVFCLEFGQTRKGSDTVSTAHSYNNDPKINRWQEIQE
jgi:hypothetical protein